MPIRKRKCGRVGIAAYRLPHKDEYEIVVTDILFAVAHKFSRPRLAYFSCWKNMAAAGTNAKPIAAVQLVWSFVPSVGIEPTIAA